MNYTVYRERNMNPAIPALWVERPMWLGEDLPCSRREELERFVEGLPCDLEWDKR